MNVEKSAYTASMQLGQFHIHSVHYFYGLCFYRNFKVINLECLLFLVY